MRIYIADVNSPFLHHLRQVFRHTAMKNNLYPVVMPMQPERVFRAVGELHLTCLVQPNEQSAQLVLTRESTGNYRLTCPLATSVNTRILMKQVLRFLYNQPRPFDVIILPCMGEPSVKTAKAMQNAFVDSIINL